MQNCFTAALLLSSISAAIAGSSKDGSLLERGVKVHKNQILEIAMEKHMSGSIDFGGLLKKQFTEVATPQRKVKMETSKLKHRKDMKKGSRASKTQQHEVVFSIKQINVHGLEAVLNDVSNPNSPNYGKHLTKAEVVKYTSNTHAAKNTISYLENEGVQIVKESKYLDYITATATIERWESIFGTKFYEFHQAKDDTVRVIRALEYSLPEFLTEHVSAVFNTVQLPDEHSMKSKKFSRKFVPPPAAAVKTESNNNKMSVKADDDVLIPGYVTPALLNNFYNITSNTGNLLGSQCVYEALNQTYSPSDLTVFQQDFNLPIDAVDTVIGGHADNNACSEAQGGADHCLEANLDVQYLMAVSQGTNTTYWYWDGDDFMLDWVTTMADMENPPLVNSISYSSYEIGMSDSYAQAFNTEAMKLGVMGVTLLAASGDDGVAGFAARENPIMCGYYPQFPASSPYVTAVGGTMGPETGSPEVACTSDNNGIITTGGGFSTVYSQPSWQSAAVTKYFNVTSNTNAAPYKGYNSQGRGYPDVSLMAASYVVVTEGNFSVVYGTSASAPVFAGMVALVNAKRLAAGKSSLGWINPSLYSLYSSFVNDITVGENNCVSDATVCCGQGFTAVSGWDPVTGLGSVNYGKFEAAFKSLGNSPNSPTLAPTPAAGAPTEAPVESPTIKPTAEPTVAPTAGGDGWVYASAYYGENCNPQAKVAGVTGVAVNKCSVTYNNASEPVGSVRYSCSDTMATVYRYSDDDCEDYVGGHSYFLGCASSVDTDAAYVTYSSSLTCTTGTSDLPIPLTNEYSVQTNYDGDCTTEPYSFHGVLNNFCFNYGTEETGYSFKYSYPTAALYSGYNCTNLYGSETLASTCEAVPYDSHEDDFYGYSWGTNELNTQWSFVSTANNYYFTTTQMLNGISITDYMANLAPNNDAMVYSIAASMTGVQTSQIVLTNIIESTQSSRIRNRRVLADGDATSVVYTVTYSSVGYASADAAYTALSTSLNSAITGGGFTTTLQGYATANNIQDMMAVTSDTATISPAVAVTTVAPTFAPTAAPQDSGSNGNKMTDFQTGWLIAAVVIGTAIFCILFGGSYYYTHSQRNSSALDAVEMRQAAARSHDGQHSGSHSSSSSGAHSAGASPIHSKV